MPRSLGSDILRLAALALVVVLLGPGAPSSSYADIGEPPGTDPAVENLMGPAIIGTLILTEGTPDTVSFTGNCKGQPVSSSSTTLGFDITQVTVQTLENFRVNNITVPGCYDGLVDVIVTTVVSFTPAGNSIVADVILLRVVPR